MVQYPQSNSRKFNREFLLFYARDHLYWAFNMIGPKERRIPSSSEEGRLRIKTMELYLETLDTWISSCEALLSLPDLHLEESDEGIGVTVVSGTHPSPPEALEKFKAICCSFSKKSYAHFIGKGDFPQLPS